MISDQGKRTNSLGFAQTDCHTCASLSEKCDRRRPRCSTCLGQDRRCGGFAMPLSWDPRRMWSDNPSVAGASKDLPNEETSVPTAFPLPADSPKRFRFVKGVSRPKKRRRVNSPKEQASRSVVTENTAVTPEVVLRTAAQNLEIFDDNQRGKALDGLADRPIEPVLQNLQISSMGQSIAPMLRDEADQGVSGDPVPRTIEEPTIPYASARLQAVPMISEISSNDHEKLLELCKSFA
ncbi:hypothetical protein HAV15_007087 [Penicillium sp. str. |nr:hypothetical protein HAV15_007087 [Penicillium sp. str. \